MSLTWPKVPPALLVLLPSIPGWATVEVYDGPPVTASAPPAYCTVGFVLEEASAGDWEQNVGVVDGLLDETGAVRCELVLTTGDVDLASVRTRAISLMDALSSALIADQTLGGVLAHGCTVTLSGDFLPAQHPKGATIRVPFSVSYSTRSA